MQRYLFAKRTQAAGGKYPEQIDSVIPSHVKYWGDEAAMDEGSPVGALERGEAVELPPVLYVQGGKDIVHPRKDLERFVAAYAKRGGLVDLALYEDEGGGFIRDAKSVNAQPALRRIVDFVHKHLGVKCPRISPQPPVRPGRCRSRPCGASRRAHTWRATR